MKSFLIKILFFLIPISVFLIGYESLLRSSNSPNIYSFKNDLLKGNYEAVVLGNSHALRGIIAENIDFNTISLANVSQSINIDILWLEEAVKKNKLKYIVIGYSVPTMTGNLFESKERWRVKNYNIYTKLGLSYTIHDNLELLNGTQKNNLSNIYNLIIHGRKPIVTYLNNGSAPIEKEGDNLNEHAIKASKRHIKKIYNISDNEKTLEDIIALSEMNSFDVIIITPPAHKSYRNLIPENIKSHLNNHLTKVDSNNKNVYWLNYFEDERFIDSYYKDSDHLNLTGATFLTSELNAFIKELYTNQNL